MGRNQNPTPMVRQQSNVVQCSSDGDANDDLELRHTGKPILLKCRCLLSLFTKNVTKWQLNDHEWALLRENPFGQLMKDVLGLEINMEIVDALLGFWVKEHCGFLIGGAIIPFTVNDIALITGLPNRGQKVVWRRASLKVSAESSMICPSLKNIEQKLDRIIKNRSNPNPQNDRDFIQEMMLYLWGCVLFPTSNRVLPKYMVYFVENMTEIGKYNWAEALHSFYVKEIDAKSKAVMKRNEGKKLAPGFINGLFFIINAWFFEHVDLGEDSGPSNPEARPRMMKWVKGCKIWQRKPFLESLRNIMMDKISYHLLPRNDELELLSLRGMEHEPSQTFDFYDAIKDEIQGPKEVSRRAKKVKIETTVKKDCSTPNKYEMIMFFFEKRLLKLEVQAASKGWEVEGMDDTINEKADVYNGCNPTKMFQEPHTDDTINEKADVYNGCNPTKMFQEPHSDGNNGHTVELSNHPKISSTAKDKKKGCKQLESKKKLKLAIAKEHYKLRKKISITKLKAGCSRVKSSKRVEKGNDLLVNLDDYVCPSEQKKVSKVKVVPLNYVGRKLLTDDARKHIDSFCLNPMKDDMVFDNISIRRNSMLEYLQGGYTSAEIIDAYVCILFKEEKSPAINFANFLYVPSMFLELYRSKRAGYKSSLNNVNNTSLETVKFFFLPSHISNANHWLLLVCDISLQKWIGYDSLFDPRHREVVKEQIMLFGEFLYEDHGLDIKSWSLEYKRIYPQQEPGTLDCGVFVMKFVENIIFNRRVFNFKVADMQLFRPQIAYKILLKT